MPDALVYTAQRSKNQSKCFSGVVVFAFNRRGRALPPHSKQCGGRPCIRGMRIRVGDVLDLLAAGLSMDQIVEEMPDLEVTDIKACLAFARGRIDHPSIAA